MLIGGIEAVRDDALDDDADIRRPGYAILGGEAVQSRLQVGLDGGDPLWRQVLASRYCMRRSMVSSCRRRAPSPSWARTPRRDGRDNPCRATTVIYLVSSACTAAANWRTAAARSPCSQFARTTLAASRRLSSEPSSASLAQRSRISVVESYRMPLVVIRSTQPQNHRGAASSRRSYLRW